jgi:cobalamin biosynthesis protein CobD/CbiB
MKIKDIIVEHGGMQPIKDEVKSAMMNAQTFPSLNQSTGSAYMNYRMGIALAGAPDYPTKMEADNWIGGDPLLSTYTEVEQQMINAAAKAVGAGKGQKWSGDRSKEIPTTYKQSPVAKTKKNKYGV